MQVTREQIQAARTVNLYDWLLANAPNCVTREGHTGLRLRGDKSVYVRRDYCGWTDFGEDIAEEKVGRGNAIDFLIRFLGYEFTSAVMALQGGACALNDNASEQPALANAETFTLPKKDENQQPLRDYLCEVRKIPLSLVNQLDELDLAYAYTITPTERTYTNICFHSPGEVFAEVKPTITSDYAKKFRGHLRGSRAGGVWRFRAGVDYPAEVVYITEAAVDALSLAVLIGRPAWYVSIGGAGQQTAIDRIKNGKLRAVLAVDNDKAGDDCAKRNADLERILPKLKDWNDDLKDGGDAHPVVIYPERSDTHGEKAPVD